ncbi:hypothetical protein PU01_21865 [Hafnia alvei]|nr:hypothetical protein PU01_21865 [Hafnia alvei]
MMTISDSKNSNTLESTGKHQVQTNQKSIQPYQITVKTQWKLSNDVITLTKLRFLHWITSVHNINEAPLLALDVFKNHFIAVRSAPRRDEQGEF